MKLNKAMVIFMSVWVRGKAEEELWEHEWVLPFGYDPDLPDQFEYLVKWADMRITEELCRTYPHGWIPSKEIWQVKEWIPTWTS